MASIFKMCGKYLIKNKYSVICYGVLCLTSSMFSMISPYISGNFIDYLIVADNISKIYRYCFAFFGLFFVTSFVVARLGMLAMEEGERVDRVGARQRKE